jgi:hypothetical protein
LIDNTRGGIIILKSEWIIPENVEDFLFEGKQMDLLQEILHELKQ